MDGALDLKARRSFSLCSTWVERMQLSRSILARGIVSTALMMAALTWLPPTLGVLAGSYDMSSTQLGRLATAELLGLLIGATTASSQALAALKTWTLVAAILIAMLDLAIPLGAPISSLLLLRFAAGTASGIGFGFGLKLCAASDRPTRMFGFLNGAFSAMMIIGFQVVSRLQAVHGAEPWGGLKGGLAGAIFALYALMAVVALILLLWIRLPVEAMTGRSDGNRQGWPKPLEIMGLLSIGLSFIGYGAVWAFLPLLGASYKLPAVGIANAASIFAFMSMMSSFAVGAVPEAAPRWMLGGSSLLLLIGGLYALYGFGTMEAYTIGCAICGFYWPFNMPLVLGILARLDKSGRASVLGGSISSAGSAIGPTIAGVLIVGSNYRPVGWMAAMLCSVAFVCLVVLDRRFKRFPQY
jgi:predicted MFS family arabinose efflux permease